MPNHASATIIGHLGREGEVRMTNSGSKVFSTTMAVNTGYGDNKTTTWWKVSAFGKTAETLEKFNLSKGDVIGFVGEPYQRAWKDKEGNEKLSLELNVSNFILLGEKKDGASKPQRETVTQSDEEAFGF